MKVTVELEEADLPEFAKFLAKRRKPKPETGAPEPVTSPPSASDKLDAQQRLHARKVAWPDRVLHRPHGTGL